MIKPLKTKYCSLITTILLTQLLTGCAIFQQKSSHQSINQTNIQVSELTHWQLKGKLIFKSPDEKFSASLNWNQEDQDSDIRLTTFLGISILKLKQNQQSATLEYDGDNYQAKDAKTLLAQHTKLNWPIDQMADWVKGINQSTNTASNLTSNAGPTIQYHPITEQTPLKSGKISQITLLDNNGTPWQIKYPKYQRVEYNNKSYTLPKQVRLKGQNTSIVIKISSWKILN